jgi:hypothetical protein
MIYNIHFQFTCNFLGVLVPLHWLKSQVAMKLHVI